MIISIAKGALQNALATVSKYAGTSAAYLACVHIDATGSRIQFAATNLDESAHCTEIALVEEDGRCLIPALRLNEIVKTLPDAAVTIEAYADRAAIRCGKASFAIPALDPADFPGVLSIESDQEITMPYEDYCEIMAKSAKFAARDDGRGKILTGVLMDAKGGSMSIVATDSYRIISHDIECEGEFNAVIPAKFAIATSSLKTNAETISIHANGSFIAVKVGECAFTTRAIEGNYPAWERLMPESFESTAKFNKGELFGAVKRAATLGNSVPVQFEYGPNGAKVSADAGDNGSMSEDVTCITAGEASIKVNAAYASEAVNAIGQSEITMGFNGAFKPLYFAAGSCRGIVMPMR